MPPSSPTPSSIHIRDYCPADRDRVVELWEVCKLTRPWNDPDDDIALCCRTPDSALLVGTPADDGTVCATVMVGNDGHRGWYYYLAVDPAMRLQGAGRAMVRAAEAWLTERGVPKALLMIRAENEAVQTFYRQIGYHREPVAVMTRWLNGDGRDGHAAAQS